MVNMVNKIWDEDDLWVPKYLQELIDVYFFDSEQFKVPSDITNDNLHQFLETILKHYQYYHIHYTVLLNLGDALDTYLYYLDYDVIEGYSKHTVYLKNDRRYAANRVYNDCLQGGGDWHHMFPEEVPFVLEYLTAPETEIIHIEEKLDAYFEQFDMMQRCNVEIPRRWKAICRERLEAIKNDESLLPIKPMTIELDMCYKQLTQLSKY